MSSKIVNVKLIVPYEMDSCDIRNVISRGLVDFSMGYQHKDRYIAFPVYTQDEDEYNTTVEVRYEYTDERTNLEKALGHLDAALRNFKGMKFNVDEMKKIKDNYCQVFGPAFDSIEEEE